MTEKSEGKPVACYRTDADWSDETDHILEVACSDGRFHEAHEELFRTHLGLKRPDAIMLPGGPAAFVLAAPWFFALRPQISLLQEAHGLKRIFAIAHEGCAYYKNKYPGLDAEEIRKQQVANLMEFRQEVSKLAPGAAVELFYEKPEEGHVAYYVVD